ncbi:MAG TPA: twin-arginine translocase TatA/TatE family subunit [Fimbriimonadaceae bacterium]|nr:twin-arginine translocase TatA/TatE family subunit [Fimbriimonadaceae bacterium]
MSLPGGTELLLILAVVMLLFGAKKLPELARSMGRAGTEFKSGLKEGAAEQVVEGPCPFCETPVAADSKFCPGCARSAEDIIAARPAPLSKVS